MLLSHAARIKASILILALSALASVLVALSRAHVTEGVTVSRTELYGRRFAPLKNVLPKNGIVGYISPTDTTWHGLRRARYFLAPTRIDANAEHDLIIGNFENGPVDDGWLSARGLVPVKDFGNGVMLLTRAKK